MADKFAERLLLLIVFNLCISSFALAGDFEPLPDYPGKWKPWSLTNHTAGYNLTDFGWNKKEVDILSKKLKTLADVIKQADTAPKGVDRRVTGGIKYGHPYKFVEMKQKPYLPATGYLIINAFDYFRWSHWPKGRIEIDAEGPGCLSM
jgi:hypothetical protein